jgi:hypothetical protein
MKKIVVLGAVAVVLGGGYAALWNYNAGHLKDETHQGIVKIMGFTGPDSITYKAIETKGFPGNITISLKDVNFNFANLVKAHVDGLDVIRGVFSNTLTEKLEGNLSVSGGPFTPDGQAFEINYKGSADAYDKVSFNGNEFTKFLTGKLTMNPLAGMEMPKEFKANFFLDNFQSFEAAGSSGEYTDKKSGKSLLKSGPVDFKLSVDKIDEDSHKISLRLSGKDIEASPEFDALIQSTAKNIGTMTGNDMSFISFYTLSAMGKASFDMDMTYKGITNPDAMGKKDETFDLDLAKLDSSDALHTSKSHGHVVVKVGQDKTVKQGSIKLDGTYQATPAMTEYLKNIYKGMAQAELDKAAEEQPMNEGEEPDPANQMKLNFARTFIMNADRLVPDLSKLGEIKSSIDIEFTNEKEKTFTADVSFVTAKYGVIIKASGKREDPDKQVATVEINLKNYEYIVNNGFDYVTEIADIMKEGTNGATNFSLDPAMKGRILEFLNKIAEKKEAGSKDMTIKISIDGPKIKVGSMELAEVMMNLMMMMAGPQANPTNELPAEPKAN